MQLPRVVIAVTAFVIGALIAIPALTRTATQTRANIRPTATVTPPTGPAPRPTGSVSQSPRPGPTATVTVTPQPGVNVVMPSSISIQVAGGSGDKSAWAAAAGSLLAGIGSALGVPVAFAAYRRKHEAPEQADQTSPAEE
jgi:hypothetical protein